MREFEELETCNLGPDVMNEIAEMTGVNQESYWTEFQADGSWSCSTGTAGGCRNHMSKQMCLTNRYLLLKTRL